MHIRGAIYEASADGEIKAIKIGDEIIRITKYDQVRVPKTPNDRLLGRECLVWGREVGDKVRPAFANAVDVQVNEWDKVPDDKVEAFLENGEIVFSLTYTVGDIKDSLEHDGPIETELARNIGLELDTYDGIWEKIDKCISEELHWQEEEQQKQKGPGHGA